MSLACRQQWQRTGGRAGAVSHLSGSGWARVGSSHAVKGRAAIAAVLAVGASGAPHAAVAHVLLAACAEAGTLIGGCRRQPVRHELGRGGGVERADVASGRHSCPEVAGCGRRRRGRRTARGVGVGGGVPSGQTCMPSGTITYWSWCGSEYQEAHPPGARVASVVGQGRCRLALCAPLAGGAELAPVARLVSIAGVEA